MPRLKAFKWDAWVDERYERFLQDDPDVVAIDTETSGVAFFDEPFCATLSWRGADGSLQNAYVDLENEGLERRKALLHAMLDRTPTWVFHNAKFDLQKLELIGALPPRAGHTVDDTQAIFHLLNENEKKGLKPLAISVLKYDDTIMVAYKSGKKKGQLHPVPKEKHVLDTVRRKLGLKVEDGYYWLPREVLIPYALRDTDFTLQLYEVGLPALYDRGIEMQRVYEEEIELIDVMLRMERNGFALDLPYLIEKTSEYGVKVMEYTGELQELTGREDFKPGAPAQILEAFEEIDVKLVDTKEATLVKITKPKRAKQLAELVLEYRSAKKIHTTYLSGLLAEQRDGIVHPWFNLANARTGRMSSSKVNE